MILLRKVKHNIQWKFLKNVKIVILKHSLRSIVLFIKGKNINFLGDSNKAETDKGKLEEEEAKKIVESLTDSITSGEKKDLEDSTKDIVKKAAHAVGSLKDTEFDIRFNPDVFSPGVKHKDQDGDFFKKQCQLVKDASDFLVTVQVPVIIFQFHEKNFLVFPQYFTKFFDFRLLFGIV